MYGELPGLDDFLAIVQAYVTHEGNLWDGTRDAVEAFLQDAQAEPEPPAAGEEEGLSLLELSRREAPPLAYRLIGTSLHMAAVVGRRVGEMHAVLAAADAADPDFAPEPMSAFHRRALFQSIRVGADEAFTLLESRRGALSDEDRLLAEGLADARSGVDAVLRRLRAAPIGGQRSLTGTPCSASGPAASVPVIAVRRTRAGV